MELPILDRSPSHHGASGSDSARGGERRARADAPFSDLMKHRKDVGPVATSGKKSHASLTRSDAAPPEPTQPAGETQEGERREEVEAQERPAQPDPERPDQHEQAVSHEGPHEEGLEFVPPSTGEIRSPNGAPSDVAGTTAAGTTAAGATDGDGSTDGKAERTDTERADTAHPPAEQRPERAQTVHPAETGDEQPRENADTMPRHPKPAASGNAPSDSHDRNATETTKPPGDETSRPLENQMRETPSAAEAAVPREDAAQSPGELPASPPASPPTDSQERMPEQQAGQPAASTSVRPSPHEPAHGGAEPAAEPAGGPKTAASDTREDDAAAGKTPPPPENKTTEAGTAETVLTDKASGTVVEESGELAERTIVEQTSATAGEAMVISDEVVQRGTDRTERKGRGNKADEKVRERPHPSTRGRGSRALGATDRLSNTTIPRRSALSGGDGAVAREVDPSSIPGPLTDPGPDGPGKELPELRGAPDQSLPGPAAGERTAEQQSVGGATRTESGRELSQLEQTRLVQRAARAIQAAPQRGGMVRLRLHPPELGSLRVEIHMKKEGLSARLEAETQTARNVLLEHLPQLRDRLAEQGIRIEQFDVDLTQQDGDQTRGQAGQRHDPAGERGQSSPEESTQDEPRHEKGMSDDPTTILGQQAFDVIV